MTKRDSGAREITPALLRRMPLPSLASDDDKESRGHVLVLGGSMLVPGAVVLAGVAALRAGAGKLQLATVRAAAVHVGVAVPEALVVPLPATRRGEIAPTAIAAPLRRYAGTADALLVGPGMMTKGRVARALLSTVAALAGSQAVLVLDGAMAVASGDAPAALADVAGRVVITPHAGEMASLFDIDKREVEANAREVAREAAGRLGVVVALKGAETWVASPDGELLHFRGELVGLGTSGSGDTLAGILAGLAARGASPLVAAAWAVWAHGTAGRRLARRTAAVGFLARELLAEVPPLVGRGA